MYAINIIRKTLPKTGHKNIPSDGANCGLQTPASPHVWEHTEINGRLRMKSILDQIHR